MHEYERMNEWVNKRECRPGCICVFVFGWEVVNSIHIFWKIPMKLCVYILESSISAAEPLLCPHVGSLYVHCTNTELYFGAVPLLSTEAPHPFIHIP